MEERPTLMKIDKVTDETPQMRLFTVLSPEDWDFVPGQVAVLGLPEHGEGYFAIASAPEDKGILEFLVKDGKGVAEAIFRLRKGEALQVKGPFGKGFPIDNYKGRDVLIQAVGSAIAPMRGVIGSIMRRRSDFKKVTAIFGVRREADFPFADELDKWREAGIEIIVTLSRPEDPDWPGKSGYVTAHCEEALAELDHPVALVCGMKEMQSQSTEQLCRLGVDECEVLTNY